MGLRTYGVDEPIEVGDVVHTKRHDQPFSTYTVIDVTADAVSLWRYAPLFKHERCALGVFKERYWVYDKSNPDGSGTREKMRESDC